MNQPEPPSGNASDDERTTIHRLEAFSDIVIGFCIAEMGINLLIPRTAAALSTITVGTVGFAFSFVLISIVWWIHHRLFKSLFVLNTVTVIMNFAMLGSLVLMVYFQQISLHLLVTGDEASTAVRLWLVSYAVVYALVGGMLWIGLVTRWSSLPESDLRWGTSRAVLASVGTIIFLTYGAIFNTDVVNKSLIVVPFVVILAVRLTLPKIIDRLITHHR
ncbi:MAG TPA: TMEM175 family protein [Candidatus Tumulicola sp.]|jgi:uncharacterized membrane protein